MWIKLCSVLRVQPYSILKSSKMFENVVLGGTFDRLHVGHKKLLTEAATRCSKRLTVGVTDESMVASKTLHELILPCPERIQDVKKFLLDLNPNLDYNIVPISDPFGPAIVDESLQLIVGSQETERGCLAVNRKRVEKQMNPLEIYLIDLIEDEKKESQFEEEKVSSSSQRMRLLGTELRAPEKSLVPSEGPYRIGLVGGSASGKTAVGKKFERLGAGVIDCDKLGHRAYEPGTECYKKLVAEFNDNGDLLESDGRINRAILGRKVFANPEQLEKLQKITWPEIWHMAEDEAKKLWKSGRRVVIFDAAVLIKAGWQTNMHQIFVCIIDREEAVKRIVERDGKTAEEANARLSSQPPNSELVKVANVVLCTKWAEEFTMKQVEKAWNNTLKYLD